MTARSITPGLGARCLALTLVGLLTVGRVGLGPCPALAQEQAKAKQKPSAAADPRSTDRDAVRAAIQSLVKAFEAGDAKALAGHWTTEGEYVNEDDVTIQGRETLQKAFAEYFRKHPKVHAEVQPESLRFVSRDAAIEEGSVSVRPETGLASVDARYTALLVREGGRWLLAALHESPGEGVSMRDLDWLVGEWSSKGLDQAADITTSYAWDANKKFLHVRFTVKEKDRTLSGSQVIGIDPADGAIHSWTFEADGGVGEAVWTRDGDHWVLEAAGTLADGGTLTETNILRRVNQDTFTLQSVSRMLDDEALDEMPPVKVTRVKAK